MRIRTNYDCTFEERDMVHLAKGRQLAATLSDGSVAFRFNLDPELLQHGPKRLVKGVVVDEPSSNGNGRQPRLLTDGKKTRKDWNKYVIRGVCPYCKDGPFVLQNHIRHQHPGKPIHPKGKHRCTKCPQRYPTANGLMRHELFTHSKDAASIRRRIGGGRRAATVVSE